LSQPGLGKILGARVLAESGDDPARYRDGKARRNYAATSPITRAFYDQQRANGHGHNDALRRLANRLVGILHGCLKTRTLYNEDTAWSHRQQQAA
jgi:hypothetical protein